MKNWDSTKEGKAYHAKYNREKYKSYSFRLNRNNTDEIALMNYIDSMPNKKQYFLQLIKDDMKRKAENKK